MPDDSEPQTLVALLTRRLKPEDKEQAADHLGSFLQDKPSPDRKTGRISWAAILWVVALVCVGLDMRSANAERRLLAAMNLMDVYADEIPEPQTGPLTEHEKLVISHSGPVYGNPKKQLHQNNPQNPAYFAQYLEEYHFANRALPEGFLEEAQRIDPENAFFHLLKAAQVVDESIESEKLIDEDEGWEWKDEHGNLKRSPPSSYEVSDQAALEEALALVRQACDLPRLQSYYTARQREVAQIFDRAGRDDTLTGLLASVLIWIDGGMSPLQLREAQQIISASAYQAYQQKDKERLLDMISLREKLIKLMGETEDQGLIHALVYQAVAMSSANDLEHYCKESGLTELEARYRQQGEALHARRNAAKKGKNNEFLVNELERKAGYLQGMSLPVVMAQAVDLPTIDDSHFRPMREAEHDFGTRMGLRIGVLLLLLSSGLLFVFAWHWTKRINKAARQVPGLLRFGDWAVVIGLGVILPVVLHALLTRYTPLGGRAYGASRLVFIYPLFPLACLFIATLLATASTARWRILKRLPLKPEVKSCQLSTTISLLSGPMALISIWLYVQVLYAGERWDLSLVVLCILLGAPGLALLTEMVLAIKRGGWGKPEQRFLAPATALCVVRVLPVAIMAWLLSSALFRISETHWIRQESTLRITAEKPDFGIYEMMVARQVYREINAIVFPEEE